MDGMNARALLPWFLGSSLTLGNCGVVSPEFERETTRTTPSPTPTLAPAPEPAASPMPTPPMPTPTSTVSPTPPSVSRPKVIEWGWDAPDTQYFRSNIASMETKAFDGVTVNADFRRANGSKYLLTHRAFTKEVIPEAGLQEALDDLKNTRPQKFTDNFLSVWLALYDGGLEVDWFDDFSPILNNMRLAAKLAKEGGLKGLFLDTEEYQQNTRIFTYHTLRYSIPKGGTKTVAEYRAQARRRGAEVMRVMQEVYPDITLLLTWAHSWTQLRIEARHPGYVSQADNPSLLEAFIDGMLMEAAPGVRIIDGYEAAYYFKSAEQFDDAYRQIRETAVGLSTVPDLYRQKLLVGFGLWVEQSPPAEFAQLVCLALSKADAGSYVWIYSQDSAWWPGSTSTGWPTVPLAQAYTDALSTGKSRYLAGGSCN